MTPGYWPSPWPAEDGGPRRLAAVHGLRSPLAGPLGAVPGGLAATSRAAFGATMCVLREPGEVYLLANTLGGTDTTATVERIAPDTLEAIATSGPLPGGPFWPGGIACHANGSLYVTYGRWCHRLAPDCSVLASRELPRDRPYNSLVILPDGTLVMKDIGSRLEAEGRQLRLPDGVAGSELVFLEPDALGIVGRCELPEGSVARLSVDGRGRVVVVGDSRVWFVDRAAGEVTADPGTGVPYLGLAGQTYGWDPVVTEDAVWFLDNGAGSEDMAGHGTFVGLHTDDAAASPLHLVRVALTSVDGPDAGEDVARVEVCGEPGGIVANPPLVDTHRGIAVGYDSGHAVLAAWATDHVGTGAPGQAPLWSRRQGHGSHLLSWAAEGVIATADFDPAAGGEQCVLLSIESGAELARVATGSPIQSVVFPCPGWDGDLYTTSFTTLTRITGRS